MRYLIALLFSLALTACSKSENNLSRFYEDGRAKPSITIATVIDGTSVDVPWSISEEFTSLLTTRLSEGKTLYVSRKDDVSFTENPFSPDLSWLKREFPNNEFVVFVELTEHDIVPVSKNAKKIAEVPFETSTYLKMGVRVRVVDLRNTTPQIVLQEMIRDSYFIPKSDIPTNYSSVVWGSDEYSRSPMGVAHVQLVEEIGRRVREYIHLAKSR